MSWSRAIRGGWIRAIGRCPEETTSNREEWEEQHLSWTFNGQGRREANVNKGMRKVCKARNRMS